jgi:ABC-type dipeptide/oligopeptide/nickel transport system permease component
MTQYIIRRMFRNGIVILLIALITFLLMHSVPGGPFDKEKALPQAIIDNLNARYHLDEPLSKQFLFYLNDVLVPRLSSTTPGISLQDDFLITIKVGDRLWLKWMNFGPSYTSKSRTVNDIFRQQLPISMQLGIMALLVAMAIGIPLGILAALRQNTAWDYIGMGIAIFGLSVPVIILGPILVWIFGVSLKLLPPSGWGAKPPYLMGFLPTNLGWNYWKFALMPMIALGLASSALLARLTRASLLQVVREDYIRTARAKGLLERTVITRHAMKNSLIPVVTVLGPMFAALITGTFVTELIFGIPGLGKYFVTSITNRDYPVIMGTILLYAVFLVMANLFVDIMYAFLDPRIRYT